MAAGITRGAAKARDLARAEAIGGLTRSEKAYVRRHAHLGCDREHGKDCDPGMRADYVARELEWGNRAGMAAVRRRVADKRPFSDDDGEPAEIGCWYFYH